MAPIQTQMNCSPGAQRQKCFWSQDFDLVCGWHFYRCLFYNGDPWEKCFLGRRGITWVVTGQNWKQDWVARLHPDRRDGFMAPLSIYKNEQGPATEAVPGFRLNVSMNGCNVAFWTSLSQTLKGNVAFGCWVLNQNLLLYHSVQECAATKRSQCRKHRFAAGTSCFSCYSLRFGPWELSPFPCQKGLSTAIPHLKSNRPSIVLITGLHLGPYSPYSFTITALCCAACLSIPKQSTSYLPEVWEKIARCIKIMNHYVATRQFWSHW